jgi:hypothetical protein
MTAEVVAAAAAVVVVTMTMVLPFRVEINNGSFGFHF